jgi:tetratricopeptide (TPR) repeat protein
MKLKLLKLLLAAIVCLMPQVVVGADEEATAQTLARVLGSNNEAAVTEAVETIGARLASDPFNAITDLRRLWLRPLQNSKRFDLVESLAARAILAGAHRTADVEYFQETRVRALLAVGKTQPALCQARALFNVATLAGTEKALLLVAKCLNAVHEGDSASLLQLAREQKAGAVPRPATAPPCSGGVLASISIDAGDYDAAIERLTAQNDTSEFAKGNLLLLAGRPREARAIFEKLLPKLPGSLTVHESIARALRAEDSNIGRANSYMLAIPEETLYPADPVQLKF